MYNEIWLKLAEDMAVEWDQSFNEGKDVEAYKDMCWVITKQGREHGIDGDLENLARSVADILAAAPMREDFTFVEPSELDEIKAARPKKRHKFSKSLPAEVLADRIRGAWVGRIAGCLLGKPVEGWRSAPLWKMLKATDNYPMHKYIKASDFTPEIIKEFNINPHHSWADKFPNAAPVDDDTNYSVFALALLERYGRKFTPDDVLHAWLEIIPMLATCTAERVAYRNGAMGMNPPETAEFYNPYREYIGAQIRGDVFGYVNPGDPEEAAEMAWRDASISHVKNGIYGEMFIAAMIAAAAVCDDMMVVIEAGLDEVPENCRLRADIEKVIDLFDTGADEDTAIALIHETYSEHTGFGWCFTNTNAMIVSAALLWGKRDFGKSISMAVQSAYDTDCNGATVGSIIGIMNGAESIPAIWGDTFNYKVNTTIIGYPCPSVDELSANVIKLINSK